MTVLDFSDLFNEIQLSGYFHDSKTFPDLEPNKDISEIAADYHSQKSANTFEVAKFIADHFEIEKPITEHYESDRNNNAEEHVKNLWPLLTKETTQKHKNSTYISLPRPFVVPGGRFQEVYYWDSYFTMLGLIESGRLELVENMLDNFAYLINTYGFIPNGNRTYFLSRSQPPYFSLMVALFKEHNKESSKDYLEEIEKEYEFWMGDVNNRKIIMPDVACLNKYSDNDASPRPESFIEDLELAEISDQKDTQLYTNLRAACESGWDFSSRWCENSMNLSSIITTQILPVDLNCLMYHLEMYLAENHKTKAEFYKNQANDRKKAILKYFWNESLGCFCDYKWTKNQVMDNITAAGVMPLFFNIATKKQADNIADCFEKKLLKAGGLMTTEIYSGQQWDAPNGWAPLQYLAVKGFKNYGINKLADKIKTSWLSLNTKIYNNTGKFTEKYNVVNTDDPTGGGEYPNQDGFGWTNGVYLALKKL